MAAPTLYRSADNIAREHTERAFGVIAEVMEDPFAENRDRLNAAREILDRGHGKPSQAIIAVPASKRMAAQVAAMSNDQLMALITEHQLPRLSREPTIDAEFVELAPGADPLLR